MKVVDSQTEWIPGSPVGFLWQVSREVYSLLLERALMLCIHPIKD